MGKLLNCSWFLDVICPTTSMSESGKEGSLGKGIFLISETIL
ncbi:hypothetical protein MNB_SV-12-1065 [hydrothermal vent metagenome]|uniref:Uncharacterized protein n=1 Tax=hydrothermal vent metagenome TaxID=652676 RepID=A0A1W1C8C2_9ZZZZ